MSDPRADLPVRPEPATRINRCRTCGRVLPGRRKYHDRDCRARFAERLALLVVTLRKIRARHAALTLGPGTIELVVMPWAGRHVSRFHATFDEGEHWQWAVFEFTIALNEQWHKLRKKLRSERLAATEILDTNRSDRWRASHFDLDLGGPAPAVAREVHRALRTLAVEAEDLRASDFLRRVKARFAEKVMAAHPDHGGTDTHEFMRVKSARDTLVSSWHAGDLEALLSGREVEIVRRNPMPWAFFFDGNTERWRYPA
jgi:hypothetical protein